MKSLRLAVVPLQITLVLTFGALLFAELVSFPGMFAEWARDDPGFADVRWPLLAVVELGMVCVQVVIVSVWRLLGLVSQDLVFSREAFRWVDLILGAIGIAWLLLAGLVVVVFATSDEPGNPVASMLVFLPGTVFALLMVVMRALLQQATELRSDLEGVI